MVNLRQILKEKSINQKQLAKLLGSTEKTISKMLNNEENISLKDMKSILNVLDYRMEIQIIRKNSL